MRRGRSLGVVVMATMGCLPAFAPNIRVAGVHAAVGPTSDSQTCMGCHVSEARALELDGPSEAPIVADWMTAEARACVDCHRPRLGSRRADSGRVARDRLPSLGELGRAHE